jgi:hypothetical protein
VKVLVRISTTTDVLVDAEYGDDDQTLIERAASAKPVETATATQVIATEPDLLAAAAFVALNTDPAPAYAGTGQWHPDEMSADDYARAKKMLAAEQASPNPNQSVIDAFTAEIAAYDAATKTTKGK